MSQLSSGLASLTAQYTDSEEESDHEQQNDNGLNQETPNSDNDDGHSNRHLTVPAIRSLVHPISREHSPSSQLSHSSAHHRHTPSSNTAHGHGSSPEYENGTIDDDQDRPSTPVSFHRTLEGLAVDQIEIPSAPHGRCSRDVLDQVQMLHDRMRQGQQMNALMQSRKSFRNPSIYEKLIAFSGIDEFGTNYPSEMYDPHHWQHGSYYEQLREAQKVEMDRVEKEKRDRTKVEFVTGTVKKPTVAPSSTLVVVGGSAIGEQSRKKSKWDSAVGGSASSSKSTIVPVVTLISKK